MQKPANSKAQSASASIYSGRGEVKYRIHIVRDVYKRQVHTLKKYIVHTHAKDGRNITPPTATERPTYIELPLGEGGVDFPAYLKALDEIGYKGFLTIEREIEDNTADIHKAAAFLRGLIG